MFCKVTRDFLGRAIQARLLEYAAANEARLEASGLGTGQRDPAIRDSRVLDELGPFAEILEERVLALVPSLIQDLGLTPFTPTDVEVQLAVHGDGGFYRRHIDLFTGKLRRESERLDRLISLVYYFHNEPKGFSGGNLRLYPDHVNPTAAAIDVAPEQDTLVAFSSWMPHEVLPVTCPSKQFRDSRFSINCWVRRAHAG